VDERAGNGDDQALSGQIRCVTVDARQHRREDDAMITVMGATGNTGGEVARRLLDAGEHVRVLGRSHDRLAGLAAAGAQAAAGDATDPEYLTEAFRGADAVYTLLPVDVRQPDFHAHQARLGEAIVAAVAAAGVPHVVALSSVGADVPSGTGFIASLHAQEARLRDLPATDVLLLRPGSFFDNFHAQLDVIAAEGVMADSVGPDVPLPMVAARDVAAVAAAALVARDWHGVAVREVLGPRDLTHAEVAGIIGGRIGRPHLAYVQVPYDDMEAVLTGAGFSPDTARHQVEMTRAFNEGRVAARGPRTPADAAATRFEDFATELAAAYHGAAPGPVTA
jgi:uncharacterized protein YbjT (DUF2867 family)